MNALDNANIVVNNSTGLTSFAFPEAKSSQTGESVSYVYSAEKKWFVFRILYGKSQFISDFLVEKGVYTYLAMIWKDCYKDGKKHRVLVPFMNLLFVYTTPEEADTYVRSCAESRYITYYYNHFATDGMGQNPPLTISSRDIEPLIRATAIHDVHVMEVNVKECRFLSDDLVRVTGGPFEGIVGKVARIARQKRVVVNIKGLQSGITTAYIPPYYLEKIEES